MQNQVGHQFTPNIWLRGELNRRQLRNPRYSLRTFARLIEVAPGRVSEWLTGKREMSLKSVKQVAEKLGYGLDEIQRMAEGFFQARLQGTLARSDQKEWQILLEDQLQLVRDPIHDVILELTKIDGFQEDCGWIARRLKVSRLRVQSAMDRLRQAGLLRTTSKGSLVAAYSSTETTTDVPSSALREGHRLVLERAIESLESVPILDRDVTSITMAIDKSKLPMAKKMIKDFRKNLSALLGSGSLDQVYQLSVQLLPCSFDEKTTTNSKGRK